MKKNKQHNASTDPGDRSSKLRAQHALTRNSKAIDDELARNGRVE
jgi:hypothetical protein